MLLKRVKSVAERKPLVARLAWVMASVEPVSVSGAEMVPVRSDEPLPIRRPDGEVVPVPPYMTESVFVALTTPFTAWRFPVIEPMVRPPCAESVPLKVLAPE